MPSVQFLYISLETKPLKLTIEKKNRFITFGSYFQEMQNANLIKHGLLLTVLLN